LGWLLPVLSGEANSKVEVAAIRRHLANRVEETAATAHFTTSYGDNAYLLLHSDRRADGIILNALIGDDQTNDLIPKLARGLLAHRKAGRWENTQENGWVLLALDRYFNTYEKVTPDFVARVWLGSGFAGEQAFKGRTTDSRQLNVPMSYLMAQSRAQTLTLSKQGAGRLYYRIGMQYAPSNLQLKPADYGFTVTRVYEAIDDPNDVRKQEDGTWRIKAGAQVRVRLTMIAPARRYHVALVDPLPAGFEALNPALATTGAIPRDPNEKTGNRYWWWQRPWYEHQNLRDERVEAFASLLWEGVHNYSYVARATTPGVFVVPPPKAEEMYHPETFGRGASERVVIE
jgi:alpha-2-macroglobulin